MILCVLRWGLGPQPLAELTSSTERSYRHLNYTIPKWN